MERIKRLLLRALNPGKGIVLSGAVITVALMILLFGFGILRDSAFAYAAYLISAYSLVIFCVSAGKWIGGTLLPEMERHSLIRRYRTDAAFRTNMALYRSLLLNLLYAVVKLASGAYYGSLWLVTLGVYYLFLLCMRCLLAHHLRRYTIGQNLLEEYKHCRICGIIMALMNPALMGVVILVLKQDKSFHYAGMLIYVVALYTFYAVISACISLVKFRKRETPVLSAAKSINLAAALVSMLALETAMLTQFGSSEKFIFRRTMIAATGAAVCATIFGMAVLMIVRSNKQLRRLEASEKCGG